MTRETWGLVQDNLLRELGRNTYTSWIEPIEFEAFQAGTVTFRVPTSFLGTWVSRNFEDRILAQLAQNGVDVRRIEYMVAANETQAPDSRASARQTSDSQSTEASAATQQPQTVSHTAPAAPTTSQPMTRRASDLPGAPLDKRYTFDRFVVGKPNELAHAAARRVAAGESVTFNPLFLYGGVGLGKTHLMHAIAWELRHKRPELKVLYLSAEQFMYRFVQALRENGTMQFKEMFRSVDILMVDDVQFIAGKDSTQEEFFHTFNHLVDQQKQIIISADRAPMEIKKLEERIVSRLQSGLVVDVHPTDYELRLGILQQKVELYRDTYPGLSIRPGVLEFLASKFVTNARVLEGALTKLCAFGSLVGSDVTLEMAQDCLADSLRTYERKVTIEEIQRQVAEHYNMRMSDMIGPKRHRNIARPRQMAMYLAKQLTARSLPEIGRRFGGRDHTTVLHAVKKVDELKQSDTQVADDLQLLQRILQA